jgi:hypothetical protein
MASGTHAQYTGVFLHTENKRNGKKTKRFRAKYSRVSFGYFRTASKAAEARDLGVLALKRVLRKKVIFHIQQLKVCCAKL